MPDPQQRGLHDAAPVATRTARGVDEWLTVIAAGQALGITAEATATQHPRPGVVYRPVRDAPPVPVWLAWWADSPHRTWRRSCNSCTSSTRPAHPAPGGTPTPPAQ